MDGSWIYWTQPPVSAGEAGHFVRYVERAAASHDLACPNAHLDEQEQEPSQGQESEQQPEQETKY